MIAYSKYKDSGIPWLGQIPEHWGTDKIAQLFAERREKCSDKEFQPLSVSKQGVTPQLDTAVKTDNGDNRKKVCAGDFVVNSRSDRKGAGGVSPLDGSVSLINTVLESRGKLIRPYIHYLLRSHCFIEEFYRWGRGIVADLWTTRYSEMKNIMLPVPPLADQEKIVAFIDDKTSKIDRYIAEREKELQTLAELKQSEISAAVTRGLNPNVPMKDSGIPWLGQIPEHWEVRRLKNVATSFAKGSGITKEEVFDDGDIQCIRYGEIYSKYNNSVTQSFSRTKLEIQKSPRYIQKGDILFAGTGELIEEIGKNIVYMGEELCLAGGDIIIMKHNEDAKFLNHLLNSNYVQTQKSLGKAKLKVVHISAFELGGIYVAIPPLAEQRAIVEYIDSKCSEINSLISNIEAEIAYLKEYKQSLIADAVTGAINVQ